MMKRTALVLLWLGWFFFIPVEGQPVIVGYFTSGTACNAARQDYIKARWGHFIQPSACYESAEHK